MALNSGLGRPRITSRFKSMADYLNKYIFPIKDAFFEFKRIELKRLKEYNKAAGRTALQKQKLERAYEGLEQFRKYRLIT